VQEGLKKDLGKQEQKRLVRVRCYRDYSGGKYPGLYSVSLWCGSECNLVNLWELEQVNRSGLIGLVKID
jgi:hypothetical protein